MKDKIVTLTPKQYDKLHQILVDYIMVHKDFRDDASSDQDGQFHHDEVLKAHEILNAVGKATT